MWLNTWSLFRLCFVHLTIGLYPPLTPLGLHAGEGTVSKLIEAILKDEDFCYRHSISLYLARVTKFLDLKVTVFRIGQNLWTNLFDVFSKWWSILQWSFPIISHWNRIKKHSSNLTEVHSLYCKTTELLLKASITALFAVLNSVHLPKTDTSVEETFAWGALATPNTKTG